MASESSRRQSKRKSTAAPGESEAPTSKHVRKCERNGCPAKAPICFASALESCAGNGYTSRWYHLSQAEHYCNECFDHFYRSHKDGYEVFAVWKRKWSKYGTTDPNIKTFMAESLLPYWAQCTKCQKWRQMSKDCNLTTDFLKKYVCGMNVSGEMEYLSFELSLSGLEAGSGGGRQVHMQIQKKSGQTNACDSPEDYRLEYTKDYSWVTQLVTAPFFKNSPAFPYLLSYFPDGVGLCATDMETYSQNYKAPEMPTYLSPFVTNDYREPARCFQADTMDDSEMNEFPEFSKLPHMYLAMRNICVTLWNLDPKKWLSHEKCSAYMICRGMTRVWCLDRLHDIMWYLTRRGLINFGLLSVPKKIDFMPANLFPPEKHVLVIGAGISGLTAAQHLCRVGIKTTVIEASDRIGGRIKDDDSIGMTIGKGAQMLNGCDNNPLVVLGYQAGSHIKELIEKCCLVKKGGEKVDDKMDSQMDFHFNAVLDIIADWRRNKEMLSDLNLLDKVRETHQHFMDESQINFTKEQETLLNFHIGNLEYACGTSLTNVSTLNWDQNEDYPQFSGKNALFVDGFGQILQKMVAAKDIIYNAEITEIDYKGDKVSVKSSDGLHLFGDKVIVTVPLSVLKKNVIKFNPPLPLNKQTAIDNLGVGYMEKVVMKFRERFWSIANTEVFGRVETDFNKRGLFGVFHDMSKEKGSGKPCFILATHISGNGIDMMKEMSDEEIVSMCIATLSELFPKKKVPKPEKYLVTRWYKDPLIGMAYSHIPVGAKGEYYDDMATDIEEKLFFAGETCNRQHPQSVTGAYLSGIREAEKVMFAIAGS